MVNKTYTEIRENFPNLPTKYQIDITSPEEGLCKPGFNVLLKI